MLPDRNRKGKRQISKERGIQMKDHKYGKYIIWGVTAFLVIVACILVTLVLLRWQTVKSAIGVINEILAPITYGVILAYLMSPVYNRLYGWTGTVLEKAVKKPERRASFSKVSVVDVRGAHLEVVRLEEEQAE